jgi:4-hydroxy-tetrahydrodipicolinate synthase
LSSVFEGLSAFPITPCDEHGEVDQTSFSSLLEELAQSRVDTIGVLGSTGGYAYLSVDQRAQVLRVAIDAIEGRKPVIAGVGALSTRDVLRNVAHAEAAGAAGLLVAPMSYLPLTQDDVAALFADIAAETSLPVCFYNNPGTTHFTPSDDLIARLAQEGLIAAVKNPPAPAGDFAGQIAALRTTCPDDFKIGYSGDAAIAGALSAGADAWYSVLAGTLPDIALELWQARGDAEQLAKLNAALAPLWQLFNEHGSIRVIHEVARMGGIENARLPRPLLPLSADVCGKIADALSGFEYSRRRAA